MIHPKRSPVSKTKMLSLVKNLESQAIRAASADRPQLLDYRGPRGQNFLHVCCGIDVAKRGLQPRDSIKTAAVLLDAGLDVNREAFREGTWKATPLWYAIGRGRNLALAKYLLARGSTPEYCMWAAAFNDDAAAVRLLANAGATIDPPGGETPLLFAVRWSRFVAAKELLRCGADPNYQDRTGRTALHFMLKKRSDPKYVRMFLKHGANADVPDRDGVTVRALLGRSSMLAGRFLDARVVR